jgi:hypothetical protein
MSLPFPLNKIPWNKNIRNVFIYFFSSGFSRSIPFLLLPLLTRALSPTDFGILGLTTVLIGLSTPFITFNAPGYIYAHYFKFPPEEMNHRLAVIANLAVFMSLILAVIAMGLRYLGFLQTYLPLWTILAIITIAYFMSMLNMAQTLNQIETRLRRYVVYEISNALLIGAFVVTLVLVLGMKWEGRFLAGLSANMVVGTAALVYLIRSRSISVTYDLPSLRSFLNFSVPILPHVLGLWALNGIARLFLVKYVSLDEAGFYQVAFQLNMILLLFYEAMFKVWNPACTRNTIRWIRIIPSAPRIPPILLHPTASTVGRNCSVNGCTWPSNGIITWMYASPGSTTFSVLRAHGTTVGRKHPPPCAGRWPRHPMVERSKCGAMENRPAPSCTSTNAWRRFAD